MLLKKLVIENYGPFSSRAELDIEEDVTVLTGQNDVGKSAVLRLIQQICEGREANEDEVNVDRRYESNVAWQKDDSVYCIGILPLVSLTSFVEQED